MVWRYGVVIFPLLITHYQSPPPITHVNPFHSCIPHVSQIVSELEELLPLIGIQKPFIMAGHSFAGFNMRYYVYKNPGAVSGTAMDVQWGQWWEAGCGGGCRLWGGDAGYGGSGYLHLLTDILNFV